MDFKINNSARVGSIKSYTNINNSANSIFSKNFYTDNSNIKHTQNYEEIDYNSTVDVESGIETLEKNRLDEIKKQEEERKKKQQELEEYYKKRDDNNGFFHPKLEKYYEEKILELEKELGVAHKGDGWEKFKESPLGTAYDYGVTAVASLTCGVLELAENVGDGFIMLGGATSSIVVSIWDEEEAERIKDKTSEIVAYDWTEKAYDGIVSVAGVDDDIAHGALHQYTSMAGTTAAYIALSCVPGGAAVTATVGGFAAMGAASQQALQSGADFDEAFTCGAVAGIVGASAGGGLKAVQGAAKGASTLGVAGYTVAGAGVAATEPIINSATQYLTYGKNIVDANGNSLYKNFGDYYIESGGALNTAIAGVVGGVSTGIQGVRGYKSNQKNTIIVEAQNNSNLEKQILSRMPQDLDEIERAKYIYNKLNEELSYSADYFFGSDDVKSQLYNKHFDVNNITDKEVVCSNWSEMYSEMLSKNGINSKVMGESHKWVVFESADGRKWLADATQPYNGFTDLTNAKIGTSSGGFFEINNEMYNSNTLVQGNQNLNRAVAFSNRNFNSEQVINSIDQKLGYDYDSVNSLFNNSKNESQKMLNDILSISNNYTDGELVSAKLEQLVFPQMRELNTMEGLGYFVRMKEALLGTEKNLVKWSNLTNADGSHSIAISVDLQNGKTAEYIYKAGEKSLIKNLTDNLR